MNRFYVVEAPRKLAGRLFTAASVAECLAWIRPRSGPGLSRLAVWTAVPPPDERADVALCLPVGVFEDARTAAADAVDRWEASWLLIASAPRRHREEAREALIELVATALAVAAAGGFDDGTDLAF